MFARRTSPDSFAGMLHSAGIVWSAALVAKPGQSGFADRILDCRKTAAPDTVGHTHGGEEESGQRQMMTPVGYCKRILVAGTDQ